MSATRPKQAGRAAVLAVTAAALLLGAHGRAAAHDGEDHSQQADTNEHDTQPAVTGDDSGSGYEIPSGADRIIGSPEAGPDPQQSGDRGGSLQFATLGAVAAAVGFIMWRISRAARRTSYHRAASRAN